MNTPSISIVTAFFDIGRSDWTTEKGYLNIWNVVTTNILLTLPNLPN